METEPLERIDDHTSGETPEDVAILYSWANLQGAKYRDFSANRREYRAQMRHRAAEQLRLMELRAQSEAEAAAAHAEAEAAAAHAEADAATVKLAASRSMPSIAPEEILKEKQVEEVRRSSLREAAQQARRAAAERLEAARRAEAAALADSIARREEREIAEAQASALRQAAQYHESEMRSRQMLAQHPPSEDQVPGRISDPYSPQILPEGEYYDGPGTPPSELEASRFRAQREHIERSTGTELPPFKMPPLFNEERLETLLPPSSDFPPRQFSPYEAPRRISEMTPEDREFFAERHQRERNNSFTQPGHLPERQQQEALRDALSRDRKAAAPFPLREAPEAAQPQRTEVVSRIPEAYDDVRRQAGERNAATQDAEREARRNGSYDGSLLTSPGDGRKQPRARFDTEFDGRDREWSLAGEGDWRPRGGGIPPGVREAQRTGASYEGQQQVENTPPQLSSATPRPSGSWLRQISAREPEATFRQAPTPPLAPVPEKRAAVLSSRPSVEATYNDGHPVDPSEQSEGCPSGFRPPWLTQAQAPRPSGSRQAHETPVAAEKPAPKWLYPEPAETSAPLSPHTSAAPQPGESANAIKGVRPPDRPVADAGNTLQSAQENVASRWFALKGVFARTDVPQPPERHADREKSSTPIIALYSLAGGVGKTSLVATLGRTLSSLGEKVLLTDTTSSGLLPFYFGANQLVPGVVRTFTPPEGSKDAPVHMVGYDPGQEMLSAQAQSGVVDDLLAGSEQVNRVLIDLNANYVWLVERIARLKPTILVPVAADMNSIVSLQSVEKRFSGMQSADGEPLRPVYLLNQFDATLPLHIDLREVLRQQLGDRLLPFVIRRSPGISEALAEGMTIVDYDPESAAAQDFLGLANWVRAVSAPVTVRATAGLRNLRWSER